MREEEKGSRLTVHGCVSVCVPSGGFVSGGGEDCASDCEVTECVLVRVFDLIASLDPASDIFSISSPFSQLDGCASQTSGTLFCQQSKRARMSIERPPVKGAPETVRN